VSPASKRPSRGAEELSQLLSPLVQLEIASIGAIESAAPREADAEYVMLLMGTKIGKQASVEQMNTLLRRVGAKETEGGGLAEPMLHLQTLALQKTSTTAMLQAMRLVEETLVARYRDTVPKLRGLERRALQQVLDRTVTHWMILIAHVAQRKDGDSSHADLLPFPLSSYFASPEDRVCMRCLFDRPGKRAALQKDNPHTYVCSACHDEVALAFPPDLQLQMPRWSAQERRDRVLHKALSRPQKLRAIHEVHRVLAGMEPMIPVPAAEKKEESRPVPLARARRASQPPADLLLSREDAAPDELAYTDQLFDFRSVRRSW
jgi:hypothetical protein